MTVPDQYYGKWKLIRELGRGGQAAVYKAIEHQQHKKWAEKLRSTMREFTSSIELPKTISAADELVEQLKESLQGGMFTFVALKVSHKGNAGDDDRARRRTGYTVEALKQVKHPHLVDIVDASPDHDWIALEYCEGETLAECPEYFKDKFPVALRAFLGVVEAVSSLHAAGFVHRDIKPGNIFITTNGVPKLGDLGLVFSEENETRVTETAEKVGTSGFMPPWLHAVTGQIPVHPTFDVYGLGKVLWCMLIGRPQAPMYHIDEEGWDIRKIYSANPLAIEVYDKLLNRTVVRYEKDCLKDASQLLSAVQDVLETWSSTYPRDCVYCSKSLRRVDSDERGTLCCCPACGHEAYFRNVPGAP